jgi:hypothetical protein
MDPNNPYEQFALVLVEQKIGAAGLAHIAAVDKLKNPSLTNEQLAPLVVNDAWHSLRRYLGFLVDVFRNIPQVNAVFQTAALTALGTAAPDLAGLLASIPNAPTGLMAAPSQAGNGQ